MEKTESKREGMKWWIHRRQTKYEIAGGSMRLSTWYYGMVQRCTRLTTFFFIHEDFYEVIPWRETVLRVHGMKSDEKPFWCEIYSLFFGEKMVHVVIERYFSLFLKDFEDLLNPKLSLIVPVTALNAVLLLKRNFHKNVSCRSCQLTCSKVCVYCDASKGRFFCVLKKLRGPKVVSLVK